MKRLKSHFIQFKSGISRFTVAFFGSIVVFILNAILIFDGYNNNFMLRSIFAVIFAVILSIMFQIIVNKFALSKRTDLILKIISIVSAVPTWFIIYNILENEYLVIGYFGIITAMIFVTIYLLFSNFNEKTIIPHITKSMFFSFFISLIFFGGIVICLLAVNFLIYELRDVFDWVLVILALSFEVLFFNLTLAHLPQNEEELSIPKTFKIITLYVAFPVYLLLLAVLYVYLIKIIITQDIPGGQINWFASFAALFYIFFNLSITQYENEIVCLFKKWGGWLMLPVFAAQIVAVYIRFNAYGLTDTRYVSMLLSLTAIIYTVISLFKNGRYVKYIFPIFAGIAIISTIGPLNFIDVPVYEQTARFETVLKANNMLKDNVITPNPDISDDDKAVIRSTYSELRKSDSNKTPVYLKNIDFDETFGFEHYNDYYYNDYKYFDKYVEHEEIEIAGYNYMKSLSLNDREIDNKTITFSVADRNYDITGIVMGINNNSPDSVMVIQLDHNTIIYLSSISYSIDANGNLKYYRINGYVIYR